MQVFHFSAFSKVLIKLGVIIIWKV